MRLYLLPLSTRQTLLYAQRLPTTRRSPAEGSYADLAAAWAARKWSEWERKEAGWQRKVVDYGNQAFRRIPYEEWGLKSVPPLSGRRRQKDDKDHEAGDTLRSESGDEHVELVFPAGTMSEAEAEEVVRRTGCERDGLHRRRLMWCVVGMPITLPFALVPVVPNLPFFYLVYRAWSHWRALAGGKHIRFLADGRLLRPRASPVLGALYSEAAAGRGQDVKGTEEVLLLTQDQARSLSGKLAVPALEVELERAIWQVERMIARADKPKRGRGGG